MADMAESFPPSKRLQNKQNYAFVFNAPSHVFNNQSLRVLARDNFQEVSRLGLVIPKKKLKRAVHRNRLKRLLRNAFRKTKLPVSCDVVILLKHKIEPKDLYNTGLTQQIEQVFSRLTRYTAHQASASQQQKTQ